VGRSVVGPAVDVFLVNADEHESTDVLSDDERAHAARLRSAAARRPYTASHERLRLVLADRVGVPPCQIRFARGPFGKPYLDGLQAPLEFSLAHSGSVALIAVAAFPVGVDVQRVDGRVAGERVAVRFLSPCERDAIARLPVDDRRVACVAAWARKRRWSRRSGSGSARR
jgi:4'-phosphopantetheinyl transferase